MFSSILDVLWLWSVSFRLYKRWWWLSYQYLPVAPAAIKLIRAPCRSSSSSSRNSSPWSVTGAHCNAKNDLLAWPVWFFFLRIVCHWALFLSLFSLLPGFLFFFCLFLLNSGGRQCSVEKLPLWNKYTRVSKLWWSNVSGALAALSKTMATKIPPAENKVQTGKQKWKMLSVRRRLKVRL